MTTRPKSTRTTIQSTGRVGRDAPAETHLASLDVGAIEPGLHSGDLDVALILGSPHEIGRAHRKGASKPMERRVADVGLPALDGTDIASVQAGSARQSLLREAVAGSEHPQRTPEGLMFRRQRRHSPTVQEADHHRLRAIVRRTLVIFRVVRRNANRDGELAP